MKEVKAVAARRVILRSFILRKKEKETKVYKNVNVLQQKAAVVSRSLCGLDAGR